MATKPTFVTSGQTAWDTSTSPKTTGNFDVQAGDIVVAFTVAEGNFQTLSTPPGGTLSGVWTPKQNYTVSEKTPLRLWTLPVTGNQTGINISFSASGTYVWGGGYILFRDTDGVGTTNINDSTTGTPSVTLSSVADHSAIVMINGDWASKTGTRTYHTADAGDFSETAYFADGSHYGVEGGYYADAGSANNKTVGIDAPTGMNWALAAVEILGHAPTSAIDQEGFRWRNDDGNESTATWADDQDTDLTALGGTQRLRMLIDGSGDPDSAQYQLEYRLSGGTWAKVP